MFERIRDSGFTVRQATVSMADQADDMCACRTAQLGGAPESAFDTRGVG